jgi:hypothetical protein
MKETEMYVELDVAAGRSQVLEADDLKHFSVRVTEPAASERLSLTLGPLGQLAGDHAWINIESLRQESGRAGDSEWSAQFDAMVTYAASKGWVDDTGERLRAHLDVGDSIG